MARPKHTEKNGASGSAKNTPPVGPYEKFFTRRTEEIKRANPDMSPHARRKQILREWKRSNENPHKKGEDEPSSDENETGGDEDEDEGVVETGAEGANNDDLESGEDDEIE